MTTSIKTKQNSMEDRLSAILTRAKSSQGAAARIYPLYQQLQTKRFQSVSGAQGGTTSEGDSWPALQSEYAAYKLKRYGGGLRMRGPQKGSQWKTWPGGGRKMLMGTSTLAGAAIGPGAPLEGTDKQRVIYKPYSMQITIATGGVNAEGRPFEYAESVAETRPFMSFSEISIQKMKDAMTQYLIGK